MTRDWIRELFEPCVRHVVRAMRLVGRGATIKSIIVHMTPDALSELVEKLRTEEDLGAQKRAFGVHLERYLQHLGERERELLSTAKELSDLPDRDDVDLLRGLLAQFRLDGEWERELFGRHLRRVLCALRLTGEECTIANAIASMSPVSLLALAGRIIEDGSHTEKGRELTSYVRSLTIAERRCVENPEGLHVGALQGAS
jgi:hypothetical protein